MVPLSIRRAAPGDAIVLHEVAAATFPLASPPDTRREDIDAFIAANLSEPRFREYLDDPDRMLFLATLDGVAVGYSMLVAGEPYDADAARAVVARPTVELSKIYVRVEHHRSGVAGELMATSLRAAADTGARSVWLGVNQRNERANRFYAKQGFRVVGTKRFLVGTRLFEDFVRERLLDGRAIGDGSGGLVEEHRVGAAVPVPRGDHHDADADTGDERHDQ
jgi:ribosomal protein S18 acetylase RimI-like enzyme